MAIKVSGIELFKAMVIAVIGFVVSGCASSMSEQERLDYVGAPPADFVGSPLEGEQLFVGNCAFCHGTALEGTQKGPSLNLARYSASQFPDERIYQAIKFGFTKGKWGLGAMPPKPYLAGERAGHIVAYIRQVQWEAGIR